MTVKSGYKGVSYDSRRRAWRAVGKNPWSHIGYYPNELAAARAYDRHLLSKGVVDPIEFNFYSEIKSQVK